MLATKYRLSELLWGFKQLLDIPNRFSQHWLREESGSDGRDSSRSTVCQTGVTRQFLREPKYSRMSSYELQYMGLALKLYTVVKSQRAAQIASSANDNLLESVNLLEKLS